MERQNNFFQENSLEQPDMMICHTENCTGKVELNVSRGICLSSTAHNCFKIKARGEKIDSYIGRISRNISREEDCRKFKEQFCCENLLRCYENGKSSFSLNFFWSSQDIQDFHVLKASIEMTQNSYSGEIEGILYFNNITGDFLAETMPWMLYHKNFKEIAIINTKRSVIAMDSPDKFDVSMYLDEEIDYDTYVEDLIEKTIPVQEREIFRKSTEIQTICKELENKERYSFTIHQINSDGEKRLKNFTYMYLVREFNLVLAATEDITELSGKDVLTGGYNRQGFIRHTRSILNNCPDKTEYAVLFFNIKNFKVVNELFGIETGDDVLRSSYVELENSGLYPVVTARIEADHFTCLVKRKNLDFNELTRLCERKFTKDGKTIHLFGRCGVFYVEDKPMRVDCMIDRAKIAKKYITDEYVQPYKLYDSSMKDAYIDKAELAGELEDAISQGQFKVYYQPVIDVSTGKVASAEALVRWIHPEKGFLSPAAFIPSLEESGYISELDLYVTKEVCNFLMNRHKQGKPVVPVSINLSWMDFYDESMMSWIINDLRKCSIPGAMARFEITETSYAAIKEDRNNILSSLKNLGSKVLLDDFGSGYSSFGMLQNYNFDILKIDMSFVRQIETNPKTRSILGFIIEMAHEMEMQVVAEGAETQAQVDFLKESGCDFIQGYYYSKPLPEKEFVKMLDETFN